MIKISNNEHQDNQQQDEHLSDLTASTVDEAIQNLAQELVETTKEAASAATNAAIFTYKIAGAVGNLVVIFNVLLTKYDFSTLHGFLKQVAIAAGTTFLNLTQAMRSESIEPPTNLESIQKNIDLLNALMHFAEIAQAINDQIPEIEKTLATVDSKDTDTYLQNLSAAFSDLFKQTTSDSRLEIKHILLKIRLEHVLAAREDSPQTKI